MSRKKTRSSICGPYTDSGRIQNISNIYTDVCFTLPNANNISAAKYNVAAWRWALKRDFEKKLGLA
jgi:hypothetical protein